MAICAWILWNNCAFTQLMGDCLRITSNMFHHMSCRLSNTWNRKASWLAVIGKIRSYWLSQTLEEEKSTIGAERYSVGVVCTEYLRSAIVTKKNTQISRLSVKDNAVCSLGYHQHIGTVLLQYIAHRAISIKHCGYCYV